jgi:hypothetical protein
MERNKAMAEKIVEVTVNNFTATGFDDLGGKRPPIEEKFAHDVRPFL